MDPTCTSATAFRMMCSVLCSCHDDKVLDAVVQGVVVNVVDDRTTRHRSVSGRPDVHSKENPRFRLTNLYPCARLLGSIAAAADADGPDGSHGIGWPPLFVGSSVSQRHTDQRLVLACARAESLSVGKHVAWFTVEWSGAMGTGFSRHKGIIPRIRSMSIVGAGTSAVAALEHGRRFHGGDLGTRTADPERGLDAVPWVVVTERVIDRRFRQQRLFGGGK